jgi:hypothetical protein
MSKTDYINAAAYAEEYNLSYLRVVEDIKAKKIEGEMENGAWWVKNDEANMPPPPRNVSQSASAAQSREQSTPDLAESVLRNMSFLFLVGSVIAVLYILSPYELTLNATKFFYLAGVISSGVFGWAVFIGFSNVIRYLRIIAANSNR